MLKKILLSMVILTVSAISAFAEKPKDDQALLKAYVEKVMQDSHELLHNKSLSNQEMTNKVSKLLRSNLYLNWMATQSLGRNVKTISKEDLKEFKSVYSDFVIESYSNLVKGYKGEKGKLVRVRELKSNLFMVDTEILSSNDGTKTKVEYLVHELNNKDGSRFLVGDIITEGVSLLSSQREEFNHIIADKGIKGLISDIKSKRLDNSK